MKTGTLARMRDNPSRAAWAAVKRGVCAQSERNAQRAREQRQRELAEVSQRPKGQRKGPRAAAFQRAREAQAAARAPCRKARDELREQARAERGERRARAARRTEHQRRASRRAAERAQERRAEQVEAVRAEHGDAAARFFASRWAEYARRAREAKGKGHGRTYAAELFSEDLEREPETFRAWEAEQADRAAKGPRTKKARAAAWEAEREAWEAEREREQRRALDDFFAFEGGEDDGRDWSAEEDAPARRVANGRKRQTMAASDAALSKGLKAWGKRWEVRGLATAVRSLDAGRGLSRAAAAQLARQFDRAGERGVFSGPDAKRAAVLVAELRGRAEPTMVAAAKKRANPRKPYPAQVGGLKLRDAGAKARAAGQRVLWAEVAWVRAEHRHGVASKEAKEARARWERARQRFAAQVRAQAARETREAAKAPKKLKRARRAKK